ncbi:hypothetical protein IQ254_02630 [Nodosilinea sp. LEGE 07088]|uniref:hypothetical protein n=1 Tax=Nodosilinea sp. LEGE 07088 TaxID=2777968 RepID=UPI00187FF78C|nr:hypothetical protein [Nodosilinea sp. LEGE 07088]MBE9136107.1 hypothetical protein [Nodosilinea sp. LEGE 07088]
MERDFLILTVYFICMGYVIYQMALSLEQDLEDQVVLVADGETLESTVRSQLVRQGFAETTATVLKPGSGPLPKGVSLRLAVPEPRSLAPVEGTAKPQGDGEIVIQVLPQGPHPLQPLVGLTVQVVNQSRAIQVTVDWDRSSITRTTNEIRRVIRHTPGMRLDLALPQVTSVVNPNQFLSTQIASEDCFGRNPDTQVLQIAAPVVDIPKIAKLKAPLRNYSLDLVVQLMPFGGRGGRSVVLLLPFRFTVELLPDRAAIPIFNWILKR